MQQKRKTGLRSIWMTSRKWPVSVKASVMGLMEAPPSISTRCWKVTRSGRVLKGPDNGAPQAVANLLIGLFSADTGKLKSAFRLFWSERPPGWWLGLKPRDPRLARAISDVAVSGGERVRQVEVDESGGDRTVITFTRQQAHPLTPAVRKRFSQG